LNAETLPLGRAARTDYETVLTRSSLLSRLRDVGDDASWRTFFETYWRLIYHQARKSGLSEADSQDVVQETVIAVAKRMPEFRYDPAKGSFKQWLLLITRRRIHDHLRRVYRSLPTSESFLGGPEGTRPEAASPELPPDAQIDEVWESEWRQNLFETALAQLRPRVNPKHYQVFDYCVLQNLAAPKVAKMLGMNSAQVYLAKHRMTLLVKRAVAKLEAEADRELRT
jgi:RNA polymerase sigma factor (sigma-70 family)